MNETGRFYRKYCTVWCCAFVAWTLSVDCRPPGLAVWEAAAAREDVDVTYLVARTFYSTVVGR